MLLWAPHVWSARGQSRRSAAFRTRHVHPVLASKETPPSSFDLEGCICEAKHEDEVADCHRMADEAGIALLGSLPLDLSIRLNADSGHPTVAAEPDGVLARRYRDIALRAAARLAFGVAESFPTLEITDD